MDSSFGLSVENSRKGLWTISLVEGFAAPKPGELAFLQFNFLRLVSRPPDRKRLLPGLAGEDSTCPADRGEHFGFGRFGHARKCNCLAAGLEHSSCAAPMGLGDFVGRKLRADALG